MTRGLESVESALKEWRKLPTTIRQPLKKEAGRTPGQSVGALGTPARHAGLLQDQAAHSGLSPGLREQTGVRVDLIG